MGKLAAPRSSEDGAAKVERYLSALPADQRPIAQALRDLVVSASPGMEECFKWGAPWFGRCGMVSYIASFKNHLNFGFPRGASLTDPDGLLEGTGKGMRHVKLRSASDIRPKQFKGWVRQAVALNEADAGAKPPKRAGRRAASR